MNEQISFAAITINLVIVVATTTLQTACAWYLTVDVSRSLFDMKHAYVEIEGPFGYSDLRIVKTGPNATVTFNIPDNEIPYGRPFEVCVHSEGLIGTLLPNCDTFTRGNEPWMWIGMYVPGDITTLLP